MIFDDVVGPISNELFLFARQFEWANLDPVTDEAVGLSRFKKQRPDYMTGIMKYKFTGFDSISCSAGADTKSPGLSVDATKYAP